ncbi:CerR family C-terminal domain-containing protein [Herminiimonas sp. NPDC097707]|uniref:CerR family C-terminal domain-containing protein n=1 Tax=Herminiimonas sp. NPDC097707 TaxID=3364007 RepID=UPI00383BC3B9
MKPVASKTKHKSSDSKSSSDRVASDTRKPRSDGVEARERLLHTALRLFAEKGYSKTSTREIAQASCVNIASIKYYFNDKAGLYRAVFTEPMGSCEHIALSDPSNSTLRESLEDFFAGFLAPLKQNDLIQLCIRLHFREMLEPTGLWEEEISSSIKPAHAALVAMLMKHMRISKADDDMHRLAFSIIGLPLQMFILREAINAIRPKLIATPAEIDLWADHLTDYAEAMIAVAVAQRAAAPSPVMSSVSKKKKS